MDIHERTEKDIIKLRQILMFFCKLGLDKKYSEPFSWAENYLHDAVHYFEKKDYFTSFGCANYAYGIIDGILIQEGRKDEHPL